MPDLNRTPLFALHVGLGAKMVPFAGYEMPVSYPLGVMKEHLHTRERAGLFDVSHMGQVWVDGPSWEAVALGFERLVPQDVLGLGDGRQRYGFFTNNAGGIDDDLMFARRGDRLFVVVNAACKEADIALMKAALEPELAVSPVQDRALVALQGPMAGNVMGWLLPELEATRFMDVRTVTLDGAELWVSRSGYTGEDGFEISLAASAAQEFCERLLREDEVEAIGLGARDSLRLEAGLCLYGQDMDGGLNPVEAGLSWAIQKARRKDGDRQGGFPGADRILDALQNGVDRKRVGLQPEGRAPMRQGVPLFAQPEGGDQIGFVTSGGFGPSIGGPVAMGIVADGFNDIGTVLYGELRGKRLPVTVAPLPFVPANFKR